ncbi:MAG: carbohydrate binding family 9 domain-containing protein [Saprospiraceae bacterium]|nr:carbohydrate binding family 9 domain-containing protein [Saprospiraceae bacterium]
MWLTGSLSLRGQDSHPNRSDFQIRAEQTSIAIKIDGSLDDQAWKTAAKATDFFLVLPIDSGYARAQTEVMVAYDHDNFYMAILCHDPLPGRRPAESLRRDFSFGKNDNFLVFIDTYNDQTNGFSFGISAAGAQWDGLQANGGSVSLDWDCKWRSAIQNGADSWSAEFAIPFRSIRYKDGIKEWGINFSRLDLKTAEKSSWAPVPRQFPTASLAFAGTLLFDEPPPKLGTRFSMIPYASGRTSRDNQLGETRWSGDVGLDAKVTLSTSMNIDLTVNPDFSQVEVDRQVTNLDRFELFFPERRQFFLENSDLFASLGTNSIRPFFSRRIGLNAPVHAGMRLSGKINEDWRIGIMNVQTGKQDQIPAANFTVAALQKKVLQRSNIGFFVSNKLLTGNYNADEQLKYNSVVGAEFNLASQDNRWTGKAFVHQALYPGVEGNATAYSAAATYNTQKWELFVAQARVGSNYNAEAGFIRRKGYHQLNPGVSYRWYLQKGTIANHGPGMETSFFFDEALKVTDQEFQLNYGLQWRDRSRLSAFVQHSFIRLLAPFDPTNTGGKTLSTDATFAWNDFRISYTSNSRNVFNYEASLFGGGYFNGERYGCEANLNYRVQPYGSIGLFLAYNSIDLPDPFTDADLVLLGPKLDVTFTNNIFFTTFLQYNSQIENLNVNTRFQWRFAPVSDFFIVYSSNSTPSPWQNTNRALVAKLSYYFN